MPADDELLAARDAYSRRDWRAAYDHFARAHEAAELSTDDLSYGMAAWRPRGQAFHAALRAGFQSLGRGQ